MAEVKKLINKWCVVIVFLASGASVAQTPAQDQTRTALIQKLSQVQSQLAQNDPTFVSVTLRWADLLVERARFESLYELEKMCSPCMAGTKDRERALNLYSSVLSRVPSDSRPKVMLQMGHLYQMNAKVAQAEQMYKSIDQDAQFPGSLRSEARLQLAEIAYKNRNFPQATVHYQSILKSEMATKTQKSLAWYRQAWIDFSQGSADKAYSSMIAELEKKQNFSRGGLEFDSSFYEEVVRDAATFLAKISFSSLDLERFNTVLNPTTRSSHLLFLGHELFRLGRGEHSLQAFVRAESYETEPLSKLEIALMKTQIQGQRQNRTGFIESFNQTLSTWAQVQCTQDSCKEVASRIRLELVNWNKSEKGKETPELLQAYQAYLEQFPQDQEAWIWAALVAEGIKDYTLGLSLLERAEKSSSFSSEKLESLLLMKIDLAEKRGDKEVLALVLNEYLAKSQQKKKASEVQYRLAFLTYESGNMVLAGTALYDLAINPGQQKELRIKAAHLSLDALGAQRLSAQVAARAEKFAGLFPEEKVEFQNIRIKALLEEAVALEVQGKLDLAAQNLSAISLASLSKEDRILVLKNRILLAEKQKNWSQARGFVRELAATPALSNEDQSYVQAKTLYFAELALDFSSALKASLALKESGFEAEMRKGVLSELSGQSGEAFFERALKLTQDSKLKHSLAFELIQKASNKETAFNKYKMYLGTQAETQAATLFYMYNQTEKESYRQALLSTKALNSTLEVKTLRKDELLQNLEKMKGKFSAERPLADLGPKMAAGIRTRAKLLSDLDEVANQALLSGDWLSQVVSLNLVKNENQKFYEELMSLPAPVGLTAEEESQYLQLLMQQASPHQLKAQDVGTKLTQLKEQKSSFDAYQVAVNFVAQPENTQWRRYVMTEIEVLKHEVSEVQAGTVNVWRESLSQASQSKATANKELLGQSEIWFQKVRDNPFDLQALEQLIQVEKQIGRRVMVDYLEGRKQSMVSSGVKQ